MKIHMSYDPVEEREDATKTLNILRKLYPTAKKRETSNNPPNHHVYLTTKKPEKPHGNGV